MANPKYVHISAVNEIRSHLQQLPHRIPQDDRKVVSGKGDRCFSSWKKAG